MYLNNKGITLIALVVTVTVIFILAGVSITGGNKLISKAKFESIETNMITIKSKAKGYAEEINSQVWDLNEEEKSAKRIELLTGENYQMETVTITEEQKSQINIEDKTKIESYLITASTLENMGISEIGDGENYVVSFNKDNYSELDIVYRAGINYNNKTYYSLSSLQEDEI